MRANNAERRFWHARRAALLVGVAAALSASACGETDHDDAERLVESNGGPSKTIVIYDNQLIEANIAIWNPRGIFVDGFRYANVFVEFEQKTASEPPLSVGVGFAPTENGRLGTRNVYDFSNGSIADSQSVTTDGSMKPPTWISGSGAGTWHGEQGTSSFVIRTAILGPYMWVYPLNNNDKARHFSIAVYLTK